MKSKRFFASLAIAAGLIGAAAHAADDFPVKPVQVVIPFAPGDTDNMLRPFIDKMGEFLGQPVLMTYKAGAGGGIGASMVAASKPDGYTLVGTSQGSIVVVPIFNKEIKYSTDSFAPVASLSEGGFMLLVSANAPWKSLQDLVDYSKKNPLKINYTTSGAMGVTHLLAEIFADEAGVKWTHIPEKGSGPAITALLGGHVEMASSAVAPALAHIRNGTLRPLATFGEVRLKEGQGLGGHNGLRSLQQSLGTRDFWRVRVGVGRPDSPHKQLIDHVLASFSEPREDVLSLIGKAADLVEEWLAAQHHDGQGRDARGDASCPA